MAVGGHTARGPLSAHGHVVPATSTWWWPEPSATDPFSATVGGHVFAFAGAGRACLTGALASLLVPLLNQGFRGMSRSPWRWCRLACPGAVFANCRITLIFLFPSRLCFILTPYLNYIVLSSRQGVHSLAHFLEDAIVILIYYVMAVRLTPGCTGLKL